jgi:hypothetical protein
MTSFLLLSVESVDETESLWCEDCEDVVDGGGEDDEEEEEEE